MKVAACSQYHSVTDQPLQLAMELPHTVVVETVLRARMRRSNDVGNAVIDRRLGHRQRFLNVGRAIIEARQDVAVHVDHSRNTLTYSNGGSQRQLVQAK